jgi:cytochrome c oxidase subunit 2
MALPQRVFRPMLLTLVAGAVLIGLAGWGVAHSSPSAAGTAMEQDAPQVREVRVVARRYSYSPARIEVQEGDLVKVTLESEDIPHSFNVDDPYRIAKRAAPGSPVVFEFRADQTGSFPYYCNLTAEDGCRKMRGDLVVRPRR